MLKPIRGPVIQSLPTGMRRALTEARHEHGWSQMELGRQLGLPQMHISKIETGKVIPRFDTLLELVRVLGYDLLLVPRSLVPAVQSLVRDERSPDRGHSGDDEGERPLYAVDNDVLRA
jgi:transcriptional regulator with XRE-family HTH domain